MEEATRENATPVDLNLDINLLGADDTKRYTNMLQTEIKY